MASSTVTPVVLVQSELATLAHKHVSVTYALIGTLILLIASMGLGGYFALKSFDNQLAKQEQRDAQYQNDRISFLDTLKANDADRVAQAQKIADLEAQIKARDSKPLPKPQQDALKPDATADTVAKGLTNVYSDTLSFGVVAVIPPETIALTVPQAQQTIQSRVDLNKAKGDLTDEKAIVSILNGTNASLTGDLNTCKDLNTKAQSDIAAYKKLAKKTKWQRFVDGAEKVGLLVGGMYLGHKL